ncbi:NAD(P)-dependent oxidoreductase [Nocardioides mesophilus]|uniref:NAD(P)-dependent oxidoreductase n=1 Tax=Nocardioides mesophilus TaxID=433659 RepID=A0A7G9R9U0_9ACTN|nr:NAD(P)-dependent oxidoreductase [Nocardioides mesophilus]QNN52365.1 NAD(P)-dependent oxidoreductase [Nocardioides mesophilus]
MTKRIGFIGLGNLGFHLAHNLVLAGFEVVVNDLDQSRAEDLVAGGAIWARTPRIVAEATDTVITCLPSPVAVSAVMTGDDGVLAGLRDGGTWIEMSTNEREEIQRLALLCQARGVACLEAPVTGGVHKAAEGEITVLVGGDESVYADHSAIFAAVGNKTFYMGALGNASIIKVITNMLAFIHLVAAGEALMLAKAGGLDLATSFEAIRASSGNSFVHETESQVVLSGSYNIGFTMDLACKDLGFATAMGADFSVPLELATTVEQTFARARAAYGGGAWSPMVVKLLEDAVGQELRAPGFPEVLLASTGTEPRKASS